MSRDLQDLRVQIDPALKQACSSLAVSCVQGSVVVQPSNASMLEKLNLLGQQIARDLPADKISVQPAVAATRDTYRSLGKDPSRYRGSSEALLRRVASGKGLYFINNVVDINNLISLESSLPIGTYDCSKIVGAITFRAGGSGETYKGIGKDLINLESLPVFVDDTGPFGSPTSDSERAMITPSTLHVAMMVIDFSGVADLKHLSQRAMDLLREHASGESLSYRISN